MLLPEKELAGQGFTGLRWDGMPGHAKIHECQILELNRTEFLEEHIPSALLAHVEMNT